MSNHIDTICVGLGCLEILHLFLPTCARHIPKLFSTLFSCSTPTLSYLIPLRPFLSLFHFPLCCPCLFDNLCTCSSAAGARRGPCRRSLCTSSSPAGARRYCCRRSLYTCSSAAGARRGRCRRSLCTCSSAAGARRSCYRRSLCTCPSAAGARTGQGSCGASWLQKDVTPELWPGPVYWLASLDSFRSCGAFLVPPRAPPALSSCPLRQPLGHKCGPTSSSAAYPPCEGLL